MGKKIAFISDIHGNIEALKAVLANIKDRNINFQDVYCLGDLVGYGPRPNEVIELIRKHEIQTVLGNYDEAVGFYLPSCGCHIDSKISKERSKNSLEWSERYTTEENKQFLRELEEQLVLEEEGLKILLTHASPYAINDYVFENDIEKQEEITSEYEEDIIIMGHTHYPYYKKVKDKLLINAGSVGRPKDGDNRACYCIVELGENVKVEFIRVEYNIEKVAKEIEESELLDEFAMILRKGTDKL